MGVDRSTNLFDYGQVAIQYLFRLFSGQEFHIVKFKNESLGYQLSGGLRNP